MERIPNPELDRLILDHLSTKYKIKQPREGLHLSTLVYCLTRCLHPDTKVLMADLTWMPAGDLQPEDIVVGVDEYPQQGTGARRALRKSIVLRTQELRLPSHIVTFSDGRFVVASDEHLWLERLDIGPGRSSASWTRTDQLRRGSRVRQLCHTWQTETSYDAGYLSGSLDSEGSISDRNQPSAHRLRVSYAQKEGSTLDRVRSILHCFGFALGEFRREDGVTTLWTRDTASALRLLGSIRPKRLLEEVVWEGFSLPRIDSFAEVVAIMPVGEVDVVGLDTTTKTLIAEGLVSHNSFFDVKGAMEPTDQEVMLFALGLGLQDVLTPDDAETPVHELEGITVSPDFVIKMRDIQCELKTVRASMKKHEEEGLPELWIEYIMGTCYMTGVTTYNLSVLYILGNYSPPFPQQRSETLIFDEKELQDNWLNIIERRDIYLDFLGKNIPPTPYKYCKSWECKYCRHKMTCQVLTQFEQRNGSDEPVD